MFVHLHTHSYYSFLNGIPAPEQLVQTASRLGMPALALTDLHSLTGAVEFYIACRSAGIQPILGLEASIGIPGGLQDGSNMTGEEPCSRVLLLAQDLSGWSSLCHLSSSIQTEEAALHTGYLPFERLAQGNSGLICLTGNQNNLLARWVRRRNGHLATAYLQRLAEIFPDRLYVALSQRQGKDDPLVERLADLAAPLRLPVVATHPVYYLEQQHASLQRLVSAMRLNCTLPKLPPGAEAPPGSYFVSPMEMAERFSAHPAALVASLEIADRCQFELPLGQPRYPAIHLPAGETAPQALRERAYKGARRAYGALTPEIQARLEHELEVIIDRGYAPLFLIMEEIIDFARQADIPTASRGSASSSLVAHCLGITTPDPVRLNLYFERFLNPARSTPPDIDTDLCSRRRDDVIRHVIETYGANQVAMVGTINTFRSRSALREVAKAHGLSTKEINTLISSLPMRGWGPRAQAEKDALYTELAERYPSPQYQTIFTAAAALYEVPHHLSVHAGGVVISPGPMTDLVPIQRSNKGVVITQLDLKSIERLGLIKIDLLGIRGLSVLGDVADGLHKKSPALYANRLNVLDSIPLDDPATSDLVQNGLTIGCFQIESPGMRATLREIQARGVDDILVALALYRPGPLTGGLKDAFVRRHLGQEADAHLHPALEALLGDTHGVILYQEQVLRIAHELAGFTLAEADLLRRAMSHFDPGKQMQTLKEKFINGAAARCQMTAETAVHIWELMAAFAGYGFPKAHAASYAQVAWRSAWCKVHHPAEFMAAVLANWGGYYSQRVYMMEARRLGLTLRGPHINYSQSEFSVRYMETEPGQPRPTLFMGLDQVRDLTRQTQRNILSGQPFHSLDDFLTRVDPRPKEAQYLVEVGALQGFGPIPRLLSQLKSPAHRRGQLSLFTLPAETLQPPSEEDWAPAEKATKQEELLGLSVEVHPLELVAGRLAAEHVLTSVDAAAHLGQRVRVAGMRLSWRRAFTGRGDPIYFMSLEDLEGVTNVVISAEVYRRQRSALSGPGPFIIEGFTELDPEASEAALRAERIWNLSKNP